MLMITSSFWVTLAPVIVINIFFVITMVIFGITWKSRETPEYLKGRHTSKWLGPFLREWWYWVTNPIAKFLIKMRLDPNSITIIGTLISFVAAFLFAKGLLGYAGWVMVFGATFDMFDGRVARLMGKESRSGAYLDSVMDRFGEGAVFLGIAYYFRDSWFMVVVILGLIGSMLVSYSRARGEGVGVVCKVGSMQRPERIVYVGVSAILDPAVFAILSLFWKSPAPVLLIGALIIIAVMTNVTAIQRIIYIMNELDNMDRDDEKLSLPQLISAFSTKEGREKIISQSKYGYDRSNAAKDLCLMILADGSNWRVFEDMVRKGELPNIGRHIIENGAMKKAVSTFPSVTGPALAPFITGCFAGTCDIPGIRWFDRRVAERKMLTTKRFRDYLGWGSYAIDSDLSKDVKTIFEYSRRAVNIFGMLNRGAGVLRDPAYFRMPVVFYQAKKGENIEAVERTAYRMFMNALNRSPDFIFYYFPTIDIYSHEFHSSHETVIKAYKRLDGYVGKMASELKERGLLDRTAIILASDHGHSDVRRHFDLDAFLEKRFKTFYFPSKFREWVTADAINMVSGNSMSNIYLRKDNWSEFTSFEQNEGRGVVGELLGEEAVDLLAGRSESGGIIVAGKKGRARISEDVEGRIAYNVVDGDPFGYSGISSELGSPEALKSTWESDYPDGILQMLQLFRSSRAGDLVVSASPGHDLKDRGEEPPHKSTHGSLHKEHMFVPFCINSKIEESYIRTADIFPTVLETLGIVPDHEMDGEALI